MWDQNWREVEPDELVLSVMRGQQEEGWTKFIQAHENRLYCYANNNENARATETQAPLELEDEPDEPDHSARHHDLPLCLCEACVPLTNAPRLDGPWE